MPGSPDGMKYTVYTVENRWSSNAGELHLLLGRRAAAYNTSYLAKQ
jgi:hypothetical protein